MARYPNDHPYVWVVSGAQRAFALNRRYELIPGLQDVRLDEQGVRRIINGCMPRETEIGWLPSMDWQRPPWARGRVDGRRFIAYWMPSPEEAIKAEAPR